MLFMFKRDGFGLFVCAATLVACTSDAAVKGYVRTRSERQHYERLDEKLKRADRLISDYFTPQAREILRGSPLTYDEL